MQAISIQALKKRYGKIEALRGIDLVVPERSIFGLVGPNGAGKSTLIKALVGATRADSGTARVLDLDPLKDRTELRKQIGYMPQDTALYDDLSARGNIRFFANAHEVSDAAIDEVLRFTELSDRADDALHTFSGGMARRVSLAAALVHKPKILFLDEPTAAVDPALRNQFWMEFRQLAEQGTTLFISTHLMDEALLCDSVAVLYQGRIIANDSPEALLERGRTKLRIRHGDRRDEQTIGSTPRELAQALKPFGLDPQVEAIETHADTLETIVLKLIGEKSA